MEESAKTGEPTTSTKEGIDDETKTSSFQPSSHPSSSSGGNHNSEVEYSHEIARRAVARAALYLGIDSMTQESLDVMADVLSNYIGRIGTTLSQLVEASGRPSNHVNVLDTLQAIQMNYKTGGINTHMNGNATNNNNHVNSNGSSNNNNMMVGTSHAFTAWQDLAMFCFGNQWNTPISPTNSSKNNSNKNASTTSQNLAATSTNGGKVGPSSTLNHRHHHHHNSLSSTGWRAPYVETIPPYPITSSYTSCANPHTCPPHVGLSLHTNHETLQEMLLIPTTTTPTSGDDKNKKENDNNKTDTDNNVSQEEEDELNDIPDSAFLSGTTITQWGAIDAAAAAASTTDKQSNNGGTKRKRSDDNNGDDDEEEERPSLKRLKISGGKRGRRQHHVANFMPAFPESTLGTRAIVVDPMLAGDDGDNYNVTNNSKNDDNNGHGDPRQDNPLAVRSALVNLGQYSRPHWGSVMDNNDENEKDDGRSTKVPMGRTNATGQGESTMTSTSGGISKDTKTTSSSSSAVVPLGRASSSRVSRILEGSMDTMH